MIKWKPSPNERKYISRYKLALVVTKDDERILIGPEDQIKLRLIGNDGSEVFLDEKRPFGTFLLTLDSDPEKEWSTAISYLKEAQKQMHASMYTRLFADSATKVEYKAQAILTKKYNSGDPVQQYVAMKIWYGYWLYREEKFPEKCMAFLNVAENFIRPFSCYRGQPEEQIRVQAENHIFRHTEKRELSDKEQNIYTLSDELSQEYIIVDCSLIPLESFYLSKLDKWKKYIISCRMCNRLFFANNLRYELCSSECKELSRVHNLALRRENEDAAVVDSMCKNAASHWYNRLLKIKNSPEYSEDDIRTFECGTIVCSKSKTPRSTLRTTFEPLNVPGNSSKKGPSQNE